MCLSISWASWCHLLSAKSPSLRQHIEGKANQYINYGRVTAILTLYLNYPQGKWAKVSLLVWDNSSHRWVDHGQVFNNEAPGQDQPNGQVGLYISDSFPAALFLRPFVAPMTPRKTHFARWTESEGRQG